MAFAIKAAIGDMRTKTFVFAAHETAAFLNGFF